jgi:8-oxo-dGTP pyrophosphatase MutT (NUDIX family)
MGDTRCLRPDRKARRAVVPGHRAWLRSGSCDGALLAAWLDGLVGIAPVMNADRVVAPYSHCSYCGHPFRKRAGWPRWCASCGHVTYRNPIPVAVLAVPVEDLGVLMVRRVESPPGLALPSGYIEHGELWQDAAARELAEETGIRVDASTIRELKVRSGEDGTLLVFSTVPPIDRVELEVFSPSAEVSELVVVSGPRDDVVFPLDADVVATLRAS